jgi:acetyl esterase/lipase
MRAMSANAEPSREQLAGLRPELARMLGEIPDYRPGDVIAARALMTEAMGGRLPPPDQVIYTGGGPVEAVQIRIHRPEQSETSGALMFIHGGGFFMGSAELYDGVCSELASLMRCAVLAVDYRLAPEHPFPAALDDCCAAWDEIISQCGNLGIDPTRVGIYGESAGAALAIGVTHRMLSSGIQRPAFLVAQEPVVDDRLQMPSSRRFTSTPIWNRALSEWSWSLYLGDAPDSRTEESSPARLKSLRGMPQKFISTRDLDPLRDEGLDFARRLMDDHVPVDLRHYSGTVHGTLGFAGTKVKERILRDATEFVTEYL